MPSSTSLSAPPIFNASRLDAYWFWDHLPAAEEMRRQLSAFKEQGFVRIYIQARLSLPRETYLSPEWLTSYRLAVDIMADLGLRAGLYDDYAWTSGQAAGRTVEGADHLREAHVFWSASTDQQARIGDITATLAAFLGPAARDWIHDGGSPEFGDWALVGATLQQEGGPVEDVTADVTLQSSDTGEAIFELDRPLPPGASWTVFASTRVTNSRIINYLLPEAGNRFVDYGLVPYAHALQHHLGGTVDCLFFDQPAPALYDWPGRYGNLINSLPWSESFHQTLQDQGTSVALQLQSLLDGEDSGEIRSKVYRALTRQMQEAFLAPLQAFCRKHKIKLTGHEILPHVGSFALNGGFTSIDPRISLAADFFGTDSWRDETAVDANNLAPQLAPLLGDSIARASGRRGCWTELYLTSERNPRRAVGQWELTPQALRGQLLRLHMLGASRIILHALYASRGDETPEPLANMRFDFAPGYNLQPWWPVVGDMVKEAAGLADFIEAAAPPPQVALLYPYETALQKGPRHNHAEAFGNWCQILLSHGHRPLICDEQGLQALNHNNGLLGSQIVAIALPGPITLEDPGTVARLKTSVLPVLRAPPTDISALFGSDIPALPPVDGVRSLLAGRDLAGDWRIVLLNEGETPTSVEIFSADGLACVDPKTPSSRSLRVFLQPQELRCLCLRPSPAELTAFDIPSQMVPLGDIYQVLERDWTLHVETSKAPIRVDLGWHQQGHADWSGTGIYERELVLETDQNLVLELPGIACVAEVFLNGRSIGRRHFSPFRFPLGQLWKGRHQLRIDVANTMANAFYANTPFLGPNGPDASGLTAPPRLHFAVTP